MLAWGSVSFTGDAQALTEGCLIKAVSNVEQMGKNFLS